MKRSNFIFFSTVLFFYGMQNTQGGDVVPGDGEGSRIFTSIRLKLEFWKEFFSPSSPLRPSNRKEESSTFPFDEDDFQIISSKEKRFYMGSLPGEEGRHYDEGSKYGELVRVRFTYSFAMMKTEVTQRQWFSVMGENPSHFKDREYCEDSHVVEQAEKGEVEMCPDHPVESVSWKRVLEFIRKLNKDCRAIFKVLTGCYRLPTEAEWEFAARGGTTAAYSFGDNPDLLDAHGLYAANSNNQTHKVGLKTANPFGLYDMHGNVYEWVLDKYKDHLPGGNNPLQLSSNSGSFRIIRGGAYNSAALSLRSANRGIYNPEFGDRRIGFRLVRTL